MDFFSKVSGHVTPVKLTPIITRKQCWTEGRSSTAVAEDLGPTATVAEV